MDSPTPFGLESDKTSPAKQCTATFDTDGFSTVYTLVVVTLSSSWKNLYLSPSSLAIKLKVKVKVNVKATL
jgi:hypothetical protein